ncbi:MAG: ABC transporter permease [Candidatus Hydrogenedentes bacterium]|nr:ABC transporter permease [Candidatus Hydrogenedentota bacterium]
MVVYTEAQQRRLSRVIPDLIQSRDLLIYLVWRDLRARYRNAMMGFFWAVLQPVLMAAILTLVFTVAFPDRVGATRTGPPYAVLLLCGLIPWQFLSGSLISATHSLVDNQNLVKKVYFPREIIPIATVSNSLINLFIGFVLIEVVHLGFGGMPGWGLLGLPLIFAILFVLVIGVSLLCASLNVHFRDVVYFLEVALALGFYATPIIYPLDWVLPRLLEHPWLYRVYMLNPMAGLVPAYQQALLSNHFPAPHLWIWPAVCASAALLLGAWVFRRNAPLMADYL